MHCTILLLKVNVFNVETVMNNIVALLALYQFSVRLSIKFIFSSTMFLVTMEHMSNVLGLSHQMWCNEDRYPCLIPDLT